MRVDQALKTGKAFRRPHDHEWTIYDPEHNGGWFYHNEAGEILADIESGSTSLDLYYEDLVAEDWVIFEESI